MTIVELTTEQYKEIEALAVDYLDQIEWTVAPTRSHLPTAISVLERISEWSVDNGMLDEFGADEITDACFAADVVAATEALLDLIATKVNYGMAEKQVATHTVTWDERGPLLDGEPLYRATST